MSRTFVKTLDELIVNLKDDINISELSLYMGKKEDESILESLLVIHLNREIDGKQRTFLAVRDIKLKPEFRGKGYFSKFLKDFESLGVSIMFHDVINPNLFQYLKLKGFKEYREDKYGMEVISLYKTKNNNVQVGLKT
jgi:hypothetical protein